ncbi:MAG TPA: hypothetical protein VG944_02095 [Fimbriimonas sp.]|nr:hypothetical protein [Fimbriimonas sp.]
MRSFLLALALCVASSSLAGQQRIHPIHVVPLDPAHLVDKRISSLPAVIHLTAKQRKGLRVIYLSLAIAERKILYSNSGRFAKRQQVSKLLTSADKKMKSLLSPRQYVMIKNWEEDQRRMGTVPRYKTKPR